MWFPKSFFLLLLRTMTFSKNVLCRTSIEYITHKIESELHWEVGPIISPIQPPHQQLTFLISLCDPKAKVYRDGEERENLLWVLPAPATSSCSIYCKQTLYPSLCSVKCVINPLLLKTEIVSKTLANCPLIFLIIEI